MISRRARGGRSKATGIRPLEPGDLPAVASLYERVARSGSRTPPPGLAGHFAETLLDHPWADPELPSLVYEESGDEISGFIGCHVRRLVYEDRPIRLACGGQLVADPAARGHAVGFFLLRELLGGAQDLAITDTAVEATRRMWTRLGGQPSHLASISWFRLFRPLHFAADYLRNRPSHGISTRHGAPQRSRAQDEPPRAAPSVGVASEPLEPAELAHQAERLGASLRLRPAYDAPFLKWLFARLPEIESRGTLAARIVRRNDGRVLGWYVYYVRRGGISDVLQLFAEPRDVGAVVDDLFRHARGAGVALLRGRLEPRLLEPLAGRRCVFRYNGAALVHSLDERLASDVVGPAALLTRLDGEWWMGHHLEPFS